MKYAVTYYRKGKPRRFLFETIEKASAYCGKVFNATGIILGIEVA